MGKNAVNIGQNYYHNVDIDGIFSHSFLHPIHSSESESESSTMSDFQPHFDSVLDDYLGVKSGTLFKNIEKARQENTEANPMKFFAYLYRSYEKEYEVKSKKIELGSKAQEYLARAQFCNLGHMILRNSNSSAILERSFSNSLRCLTDNRYKLRHDFKIS